MVTMKAYEDYWASSVWNLRAMEEMELEVHIFKSIQE